MKGNLVKTPYSEITATLELLASFGVESEHLEALRKAASWNQRITAEVLQGSPFLMSLLAIEDYAKKAGFREADFGLIAGDTDKLGRILSYIRGYAEIKPVEHAINLGADPFLPDGWKVEEHQKGKVAKLERRGDDLYFDGKKIDFYLSKPQKKGGRIEGNDLRKELGKQPVLNANVLDYLLKNPSIIPDSWKKDADGNTRYIFFWGTVYCSSGGNLYVRYLRWVGVEWIWDYYWLDGGWDSDDPAAVSAS